ncbi:MAG: response regulator [Blastocatellia bacterium]
MRIFIVDDSTVIQERLVTLLSGLPGLEIVGRATNTKHARRLIQKLQPDVVTLDIQMPGGSGLELLQHLKQQTPCPLVMMMTSNSLPQYRKRCLAAGADYFFDKATEIERLRETLCQLLPRFTPPATEQEPGRA